MRTRRILLVTILVIGIAFTARWWLPLLLKFLSVNNDLIQTLDSRINLVSNLIVVMSALSGYVLLRDQKESIETLDQRNRSNGERYHMAENPLNKSAEESKIEVGKIEVGRDVEGNVIVGHGNVISQITNFFQVDTKAQMEKRNRRVMLDHVENFWVKGVLEKSLHGAALLELGIKEDPSKVSYPWAIKKESTDETLPTGKSMLEIFQEIGMGRSLLILGAPGSGKTTMLLELGRQLIERARKDDTEPIPVVFNLASWREKQAMPDWLAEQLNIVYYVPKKTAPAWVQENRMLLLLDGLDEVKAESRVKCVEAINQFRKVYGLTSLVVCSRIEEYELLRARLSLEGAITLQPLSSKQINAYFDRFGKSRAGVKQSLKTDKDLQELAQTPLMLSIMALAYKGLKPEEFVRSKNKEDLRKYLFDTYINRMFERRTQVANSAFTKTQTLHYLSWLARKMKSYNVSAYQIEMMQPSWLEDNKKRGLYRWIIGPIVGTGVGLLGGLIGAISVGPIAALIGFLFGWLVVQLSVSPFENDTIRMVDRLNWSWNKPPEMLRLVLLVGLFVGLFVGLVVGLLSGLLSGLVVGPLVGLVMGLWLGAMVGVNPAHIEETTYPGQRLKQTFFNSLSVAILSGLIGGALGGLLNGLIGGRFGPPINGPLFRLLAALAFGLMGGLFLGIDALIKHFTLRFLLIKDGFLPRRLIPFLDYAVDLIFLRRVGGSYIFIHRLIMEHFAEMDV